MPTQLQQASDGRFIRTSPAPTTPSQPVMSPSDTSIMPAEFGALRDSNKELQAMMQEILRRLPPTSITAASLPNPPVVSPVAPPLPGTTFIPPIVGIGANGTSSSAVPLSLHTRFPDVDSVVIAAIITHEFKAADLHKLDLMNRDKETAYTFNGATNQFKISHRTAKEYKTPFAVLIPLQ
ncbi:hypothetical protein C0992_004897, partial [Termitomyces sp. T32_za158]